MRDSSTHSGATLWCLRLVFFSLPFSIAYGAEVRVDNDQMHLVGVLHSSDRSESRVIVQLGDDAGGVFAVGEELANGVRVEAIETDRMHLRAGEREWTVMLDGRPHRANDSQIAQAHSASEDRGTRVEDKNAPDAGGASQMSSAGFAASSAMRRMQDLRSSAPVQQIISQEPVAPPRSHRSAERFSTIRR